MNNDTGENGETRESHSVTLQWCSYDQSKTITLILVSSLVGIDLPLK